LLFFQNLIEVLQCLFIFDSERDECMSVVLLLIAFSIVVAAGFLVAFIWSVRSGQYDDEYGHSVRILFQDDAPVATPPVSPPVESEKSELKT
jgi:cbb3-type cytochrome oxidase maturation protein